MSIRFHEVNKPSREKTKQIAEELWVQYEPYIEKELREGITVAGIAYRIKKKLIPGFAPTVRQLRHRMQNRRKTSQDLTRQIIRSPRVMTDGPPEPPTMTNNQFIDRGDQNLLLPSGMHFRTNFENMPMELDSSERESFSTPCKITYLGIAPASTRYGASSDLPTLDPSFLPPYFTNNPVGTLPFNHNLSIPNSFNTPRSSPLAISDNLTTQAVALSLGGSPSPSNSDMNRTIFLSEERNTQRFQDLALQMIENNLLTGATIDAKSLQFMKLIPPEAAEHILPKNFNNPRNIETAQKTFWLSIKARNCGLILGFFRLHLVCTPNMINAAYDLAMRCQDLKLVEHLVGPAVNLGTYDPFAGSIIHDHFPDIGVEDTSDPWDEWHHKRQQGDFYVSSLEFASMQQNLPLVQLLLQNKANPETRPPNGSKYEASLDPVPINPLYCAISGQIPIRSRENPGIVLDSGISQNIVRILIDTKADVDSSAFIFTDHEHKTNFKRKPGLEFTPIYIAASRGEVEIVKYLLISGAQIKKKSPGQLALLGLLANSDHINGSDSFDIAKLLIDSGIDIHLTEDRISLHNYKVGLNLYSRNAIDLAYQFAQMEIIRLLHDNGAIAGERTLLFAIKGANSISIHEILSSTVTSKIFILAILEALIQKMQDVVSDVLIFTRAKYGLELEKLLVEEDDISDLMECIATAIELEYEDIARQLISIAEALPSMPGMRAHFQATCVAAKNNWSSTHAHNLFKVAKYPTNIWDMKKKDWLKLCTRSKLKSPLEPWDWNSGIIKVLLDHKIYPTSSEAMTLAILVCARDGVKELVKRLFNLTSEELLIDVPASDRQIHEFMRGYEKHPRYRTGYYTNDECPSLSDTVSAGHFKIAELLLRNGFPVDDAGFNIALQKGNFKLFSQFIYTHAGWSREIDVEYSSIYAAQRVAGRVQLPDPWVTHGWVISIRLPIGSGFFQLELPITHMGTHCTQSTRG